MTLGEKMAYQSGMPEKKECCGNCKNHSHDDDGWICDCDKSEYFSDWTDYSNCCDEYEERGE